MFHDALQVNINELINNIKMIFYNLLRVKSFFYNRTVLYGLNNTCMEPFIKYGIHFDTFTHSKLNRVTFTPNAFRNFDTNEKYYCFEVSILKCVNMNILKCYNF